MELTSANFKIRTFRLSDAESLAPLANNRKIWRNVRDLFPHPYTQDDSRQFITGVLEASPETCFAIEVDGAAVGTIGVRLHTDIERIVGEIGYWLGEPYWGRGLMTEAVRVFSEFAFREYSLLRLQAWVYEWNLASARVLEKAGYQLEGIHRRSAIKDGVVIDRKIYALLAPK